MSTVCGWSYGYFIALAISTGFLVGLVGSVVWSLTRGLLEVAAWWLFMRGWSLKERR